MVACTACCVVHCSQNVFNLWRMADKTESCRHVYRPWWSASGQPLRTWRNMAGLPHRIQALEAGSTSDSPQQWRFVAIGAVSMVAWRVKWSSASLQLWIRRCHERSWCMCLDQSSHRPWSWRVRRCSSCSATSLSWMYWFTRVHIVQGGGGGRLTDLRWDRKRVFLRGICVGFNLCVCVCVCDIVTDRRGERKSKKERERERERERESLECFQHSVVVSGECSPWLSCSCAFSTCRVTNLFKSGRTPLCFHKPAMALEIIIRKANFSLDWIHFKLLLVDPAEKKKRKKRKAHLYALKVDPFCLVYPGTSLMTSSRPATELPTNFTVGHRHVHSPFQLLDLSTTAAVLLAAFVACVELDCSSLDIAEASSVRREKEWKIHQLTTVTTLWDR